MRWKRIIWGSLLAVTVLGIGAIIGTVSSAPLMAVYNPSPSMPIGWYLRVPLSPAVGRIVVIDPPLDALVEGWPEGVRLIKPVAAVGGDHVCVRGRTHVLINSQPAAPVQPYPSPRWEGCRTLAPNELFLLAPHRDDSVDSRIYGPIHRRDVRGVFIPLWTKGNP
jgi:type IV secretory pathway protease TraF